MCTARISCMRANNTKHIIRHDTPLTAQSGTNRDNGGNMGEHTYARAEYTRSRCLCKHQNCGHNLWLDALSRGIAIGVQLLSHCGLDLRNLVMPKGHLPVRFMTNASRYIRVYGIQRARKEEKENFLKNIAYTHLHFCKIHESCIINDQQA